MAASKRVPVEVQDDFLARQTKAKPVVALAELIWNSLDADASSVQVDLVRHDLAGGLSKIVVLDTGDGFSHVDAASMFGQLGGSWKRLQRQTQGKKRLVHGQEGRGRYKALALGRLVNWKVCYAQSGKTFAFEIAMREG
ncbi:MAG: ATP-binding protein, partial [Alphaproteobacteria bacterium]|nr:ATP-binding protein [Alphaproteobacteria bacterium]